MRHLTGGLLVFLVLLSSGCEGTDFRIDPLLATDTITLGVPSTGLPSALDVTALGGIIRGGRFPERQSDAEQWDVAIRLRDGELVFVPAGALGLSGPGGTSARAGITRPIPNQTFGSLREAPGRGAFLTDSAVVIQEGAVYVVRSRVVGICPFGVGSQFAKLQPLAVDVAAGTVELQLTTNERCDDPRLVVED